jgi:hypothetical protein
MSDDPLWPIKILLGGNMNHENGYYWVQPRIDLPDREWGDQQIGKWDGVSWWFIGRELDILDNDVRILSGPIKPPKLLGGNMIEDKYIKVFYERPGAPNRRTVAVVIEGPAEAPEAVFAFATTSTKDQFCKRVGRNIAIRRLKQALTDDAKSGKIEARGFVREAYLDPGNERNQVKDILRKHFDWRFAHRVVVVA